MRMLVAVTSWIVQNEKWIVPVSQVLAGLGAFAAATFAWRAVRYEAEMVRAGMQPALSLTRVIWGTRGGSLAADLMFTNNGRGPGNVLALDCKRQDMNANIGTPINVGPEREGEVKVWPITADAERVVEMSVYYWDMVGNCYRTELVVRLQHKDHWFVDRDRTTPIMLWPWLFRFKKPQPEVPRQWDKTQGWFHRPWWK